MEVLCEDAVRAGATLPEGRDAAEREYLIGVAERVLLRVVRRRGGVLLGDGLFNIGWLVFRYRALPERSVRYVRTEQNRRGLIRRTRRASALQERQCRKFQSSMLRDSKS